MTAQEKPAPVLLAIGAAIGTMFGVVALLVILRWPSAVLTPATVRVALAVLCIIGYLHVCQRRMQRRMSKLERLIRYNSVADGAERMLRDG